MPFEDDLDDFAPAMEVVRNAPTKKVSKAPVMGAARVAPTRKVSKAQSVNVVVLNEGRDPFQSPADVHRDMKLYMRDILHIPKNIHYQGTTAYTTVNLEEMQQLIDACFSMSDENWKTGDPHDLPDTKMIHGDMDSVNLIIATLTAPMGAVSKVKGYDKPARKEIIHRQVNGGETPIKVMKKEPTQTPSKHRVSGAPVLLALEPGPEKLATFKFYDGAHRKLPNLFQPDNLLPQYPNLVAAKTALMKKYERFWMKNGREYNMKIAIFIARNRLTFYANGGGLG